MVVQRKRGLKQIAIMAAAGAAAIGVIAFTSFIPKIAQENQRRDDSSSRWVRKQIVLAEGLQQRVTIQKTIEDIWHIAKDERTAGILFERAVGCKHWIEEQKPQEELMAKDEKEELTAKK
ncbi:TPA: hypothetical protein HA238_02090 [Candidatus Micrarchaeota archaeon]|nr:hypothetical protein [Candidatus Micrarchaeota archaeon]